MDESGLERHLEQHPFDAETLSVYADWLEECGDRRAPLYRALGLGGAWAFGIASRSRPHVIEALRCGTSTTVTLIGADTVFHFDAERTLFQFSNWCAWEVVNQTAEELDPRLRELLVQNSDWLRDGAQRPSLPSELRDVVGRVNSLCRMAVYDVALSGAKLNSRFAEASEHESVSYRAQNYKLMSMLIDSDGWSEGEPSAKDSVFRTWLRKWTS